MAQPYEPPAHIPPFAKSLAPYIKSRQEALRIRQALTSYLRSLIVFDDAEPSSHTSHLALCAPTEAVKDVKHIPADLTGLRKEYLKALQANIAARKEYRAVLEEVHSLRRQRSSGSHTADPREPGTELRDYLQLMRDRRRHTKLQIFKHYLHEVQAKETTALADAKAEGDPSQELLLPQSLISEAAGNKGADTNLDGLVERLERAVLQARCQLAREKQLFEKIKSRHDANQQAGAGEVSAAIKVRALQRTRDELVQWVEERLVEEGDPKDGPVHDLPPEEIEEAQRLIEQQKANIAQQYTAYLEARRELLDAASRACQPVVVAAKPSSRPTYRTGFHVEEVSPPDSVDILSFATETLIPLSQSQRALALHNSFLSGLLAKEKSTTLRALHRLSDESHLIPEYPLLTQQPRFKNAVAALSSRNQPQPSDQDPPDEVVSLAEAWAFASNAAAANERDLVQQKIALGREIIHDARKTLDEVYRVLNQDLETVMRDDLEHELDASDIWTSEARSTRRVGLHSQTPTNKRPKGPWAGLDGRIGVEP